ncbi:MAG: restriction endonuclease [Pseudomonadota bacterium]
MTDIGLRKRIQKLCLSLRELTEPQLEFIESIVAQLRKRFVRIERNSRSDIVDEKFLRDFGDVLRIHHCLSKEALSKDRFEYAFERTLNQRGKKAELAPSRARPGYDITIDGEPCSLKTQADKEIKDEEVYISKFMELGKGRWSGSVEDFIGLREQFLKHMKAYDRIFSLRSLSSGPGRRKYELVEIPKTLLREARNGKITVCKESRQKPKPGYCNVSGAGGKLKFQLYFDGGTERKLQIKHIQKHLCTVHARWEFDAD